MAEEDKLINLDTYYTKLPEGTTGKEFISFLIKDFSSTPEELYRKSALLRKFLKRAGIDIQLQMPSSDALSGYGYLTFIINLEKYNKVLTRKAGRKRCYNKEDTFGYAPCTISELHEKLLAGKNKSAIARELGCSRITLYRILDNLEDNDWFGDSEFFKNDSIWNYTS